MVKSLVQNPPLIALLVGDFFRYMVNFIMSAAAAYYFAYVAQNQALLPVYLLIGAIAQVVGAYLSGSMARALSTRTAAIISLFGLAVSLFVTRLLAFNITTFFIVVMVARFLGVLTAVMVALYTDTAVYGEWKTGENASPFIMGLMNISIKTAVISRGTLIPLILGLAGFVVGADPATASLELKTAVTNVFLLVPGFCPGSSFDYYLRLQINQGKISRIPERNRAKKFGLNGLRLLHRGSLFYYGIICLYI